MQKMLAFFAVLRYGSSVTDPAIWKVRQNLVNTLVGLLGAMLTLAKLFGYGVELDHEQILALASGIAVVVGVFNLYLTTATTTKIGLPPSDPTAVRTGSGDSDGPGNGNDPSGV